MSEGGEVRIDFVDELHRQLGLALEERGWTKPALVNWLDRRLPASSRRDITRTSTTLFIAKALDAIDDRYRLGLDGLARAKYRVLDAIQKAIARYRNVRQANAFQTALFSRNGLDFETSADLALVFNEHGYAYNQPYKGGTTFKKHLFRVIGDLESSGEEYDCAIYIERHPSAKAWVRNTSGQANSFWLQTGTDKFYPDFLVLLNDGRIAAIEYKGSHLATADDAKEKRLVGELWADRSGGACIFNMIENREFDGWAASLG